MTFLRSLHARVPADDHATARSKPSGIPAADDETESLIPLQQLRIPRSVFLGNVPWSSRTG